MAGNFDITVSPDRMSASLAVRAGVKVDPAEVLAAVAAMKITGVDEAALRKSLAARGVEACSFSIASGKPAVEDRSLRLDYRLPIVDGRSGAICKVEAGQVVAGVTTGPAGADGVDVFGTAIPHKPPATAVGRNLTIGGGVLSATKRGNLRLTGSKLSVEPLLELAGDALERINIYDGDVLVRGTLVDGPPLDLSGCLVVNGAMEAVQLTTGGHVVVKGGIVGKQRGRYSVGGDLRCRFITGAGEVNVAGSVEVQSEIVQSRVLCMGRLTVAHGPICGGDVAANGGISCTAIGNASGLRTVTEVGGGGRDYFAASKAKVDANQKRVELVRNKIEPLMRMLKQLTPQQRERVTELLSEADELEVATETLTAEIAERREALNLTARPVIEVADVVHANVLIRIGGLETLITSPLRGPLQLIARTLGNVTSIVAVEPDTNAVTELPSTKIEQAVAA